VLAPVRQSDAAKTCRHCAPLPSSDPAATFTERVWHASCTTSGKDRWSNKEPTFVNEKIFGIHGAALEVRSQRMGVLASNIANAATPGFKARDIDFGSALKARLESGRMGIDGGEGTGLVYRRPTMQALDGNTVELAREQIAFAENAVAYSATLSFVQGKVSTITRAIKGE
jgi:flagellar basal-body rod protein FlgB